MNEGDFYREHGYVHARGVFAKDEVEEMRAAIDRILDDVAGTEHDGNHVWGAADQATVLKGFHNLQYHDAVFARAVAHPRLVEVLTALLGPNVQLHHTKMFIKPPEKGSPFPMHQDVPYFPHDRHSMIAAILHFDDAPPEKGCVRVVPGSHKLGPVPHVEGGGWHLPFEQYPIESSSPCPAEAGDVLFFSYLTIHGSGINESSEARTTLLVQMRDPTDPPTVKTHESRGQGMMLRGIAPVSAPAAPAEAMGSGLRM